MALTDIGHSACRAIAWCTIQGMTITFRRRTRSLGAGFIAAFLALALAATLSPVSAPAFADVATPAPIALRSLSFSPGHVDATSGTATVDLTWTLADSSTAATDIFGTVYIRREGTAPGTFAGATYAVDYALDGKSAVRPVSGDIKKSTYRYTFPVPQYGAAAQSGFAVVKVTVSDDTGTQLTIDGDALTRYQARFAATTLVDNSPPILRFDIQVTQTTPTALYDGEQPAVFSYTFLPADAQSGLATGRLTLAGPGGASAGAEFFADATAANAPCRVDPRSPSCTVKVTLPPNAPEGTWRIRELSLTDAVGNTAVLSDLDEAPVVVSGNRELQATDFAVSPTLVNNWLAAQTVQLSLTPTEELSSIAIQTDGVCQATSTTPTAGANGAVWVPILVSQVADSCRITAIQLTSVTGHVALYGSPFRAPALDLLVQRLPNTTPPLVDSAHLAFTQMTSQPFSQRNVVSLHVQTTVGITRYSVSVYDANGNSVGGTFGGANTSPDGMMDLDFAVPAEISPGTYTVGFELDDASGLVATYGMPGSPPVPGGPLVFTVSTPDGQS